MCIYFLTFPCFLVESFLPLETGKLALINQQILLGRSVNLSTYFVFISLWPYQHQINYTSLMLTAEQTLISTITSIPLAAQLLCLVGD